MVKPSKIANQPRKIRKNVYFTEAEYERFAEVVATTGLAESVFLRRLALSKEIRPQKHRSVQNLIVQLSHILSELNKIGSNINQLAKRANERGYVQDAWGFEADLEELKRLAKLIEDKIKEV